MKLKKSQSKDLEDIKNIKVEHTTTEEDLTENPSKIRETFIKNMNENKELRLKIWEKVYWDAKSKLYYRNDKNKMLNQAEEEWALYSDKDKIEWYNLQTNDGKSVTFIKDILYIVELVKSNKGNMKKVWSDLKLYGKHKKNNGGNKE